MALYKTLDPCYGPFMHSKWHEERKAEGHKRALAVYRRYEKGETISEIADDLALTRQRVHQLVERIKASKK
jgi:DNA-binding transcriptional regulator LsrR (DeoR family)